MNTQTQLPAHLKEIVTLMESNLKAGNVKKPLFVIEDIDCEEIFADKGNK